MSCDSILFAELTDEETNMKVAVSVHVYSDMTAELVFDEMPHCISKVFAAPQRKQRPDTLEFEHSTIDATLSVESAKFKDTSTELNSDLDNKTAEAGFVTATLYSQPLVIVTGDTKSEFERHEALSTGFIFPDLEKIGVVSSMFDEMPDSRVVYRYRLTSEYVAAPHMLLHFPFDPGSAVRLVIDRGATEACVGHTAICLSSVEGKFWVSESGQKSDMESGCKLFKTKPEKDNFAAFCGMKEIQCQATKVAGATVGFNVTQVITKPIVAAIAYGLDKNVSKVAIKKSAKIFNKMGDLGFPAT
ncbi:hypothetical protein A4A49_40131 [Nicotiana attenuata]|uniref:Uncharacterized protein n=1 Tax=Nicotiana attenuata TaxID=49451 RepID=A0A1J6IT91_NICAT|nr:hypothetical protein A4A49_40131 [Nicotiana attenuata]